MFGLVLSVWFANKAYHFKIKICHFISLGNDHKACGVAF